MSVILSIPAPKPHILLNPEVMPLIQPRRYFDAFLTNEGMLLDIKMWSFQQCLTNLNNA